MEVRIYSQDLKFQGVSENQTSVIWNRKYYDVGNFEIHLPITSNNVKLYQINNMRNPAVYTVGFFQLLFCPVLFLFFQCFSNYPYQTNLYFYF